ncbi:unnamed protein product [Pleuronectes platessa]|uniref:Uncharacterized protein n=1 Tax=Pleuronectes platessa TaxID=8262 RepID=A0A9N7TXY6_PLEPL|nr:unnamed protein product [Pleuronectes platessa]
MTGAEETSLTLRQSDKESSTADASTTCSDQSATIISANDKQPDHQASYVMLQLTSFVCLLCHLSGSATSVWPASCLVSCWVSVMPIDHPPEVVRLTSVLPPGRLPAVFCSADPAARPSPPTD